MTSLSNYPGGFPQGLMVRGLPLVQTHPGKVFWVDNSSLGSGDPFKSGSNGNKGTYNDPFSTIDYAIGMCRANKGDIIFVKPGHTETVTSSSLTCDVAGVAIIGLGSGAMRPTLTFSTAAATINVTAANVTWQNVLFKANFADVATYFTVTGGTNLTIDNCEFRDTSSILNALSVVTTVGANGADGLTFTRNHVTALGTTAATTAIIVAGAQDRLTILENFFNYAILNNTATVVAGGANNMTNVRIGKNVIVRPNTDTATGGLILTSSSTACTGMVYDNYMRCLDSAAIIIASTGTKLGFTNNLVAGEADKSAFLLPAADTDA